jgi:aminopeptidase-like protein
MQNENPALKSPASAMYNLLEELWPLHRTINCEDTDRALEICGDYLDHPGWKIHEYEPKKDVYTWWVPEGYQVNEAWLEINGDRVADFHTNPLHLLSYSLPRKIDGKLSDIREHLWTSKKKPDAIPWEFKYYERSWGFCLTENVLAQYEDDATVKGVIDVEFTDKPMRLGEFFIPGETDEVMMFMTNICHPNQVNDSIAGLVVGLEMAKKIARLPKRKFGFRLLVVPETIGTIAWFAENEAKAVKTKYAWFSEMVGHDNSFILQHSRQANDALIDKAFLTVLKSHRRNGEERTGPFRDVVASDEMISNGPGFDIPTPSLTRWPYDEYHTSDDNPSIIEPENLDETLSVFMELHDALENNRYVKRLFKGPIMLSRFGLWVDWREDRALNLATEKIMLMLEGQHTHIDIAFELNLPVQTVQKYLGRLLEAGLIEFSESPFE